MTTTEEEGFDFEIVDWFQHPNFTKIAGAPVNDVAIWIVKPIKPKVAEGLQEAKEDLEYEQKVFQQIKPIKVSRAMNWSKVKPGSQTTVIGWGTVTDTPGAQLSPILNQVQINVIDHEKCVNNYMDSRDCRHGDHFKRGPRDKCLAFALVPDATMCAGEENGGKDSCGGDSGGPMIVKDNFHSHVQVGITSWGQGCGRKDRPGVYVNIGFFSGWIHQMIKQHGYKAQSTRWYSKAHWKNKIKFL